MTPSRLLPGIAAVLLSSAGVPMLAQEAPRAKMPGKHFALFDRYCLDCHDADTEKGEVNLEDLAFELDTIQSAELWQKVLDSMNSGEMPPEDKTQVAPEEKTAFLEDLSQQLVLARSILSDSGGLITMRRLNRREYENTIRDLLGVDVDTADLPDDANSDGFDTAGASLFFSSDQFEQYLKIARRALEDAITTGPRPETNRVRLQAESEATKRIRNQADRLAEANARGEAWRAQSQQKNAKPPTEFGFIDPARVDFETGNYRKWWPGLNRYLEDPLSENGALLTTWFQGTQIASATVPRRAAPGKYILRARVAALSDVPDHRRFLEVGTRAEGAQSGELELLGCYRVSGTLEDPQTLEVPVTVTKSGDRNFGFRERLPNSRDAARYLWQSTYTRDNPLGPLPALWVDWIEIEGPFHEQWPPPTHRRIFFKGPDAELNADYAREILARFARKAFRTAKPSEAYLEKLMGIYRSRRAMGEPMVRAIVEPLSVILASPGFLYLNEPAAPGEKRELTDLELAVRLSYFLWSSPPDAELYDLARRGKLHKPDVLKRQTNRMLGDPRAAEFVSGFTHQWLHMERLDFFQFNFRHYWEFDESVKAAAREEIYQTLQHLLRGNLSLGNLLKSDFVVINDLLADYYGIEGVGGSRFRKVEVPPDSPRGGLLGTAAVLAMGSDGERSSPVERGAWVLRNLLHNPPPPAPPNVPQLSRHDGKLLSVREQLSAHMEEPQCAQCHKRIDPIGFGLENFDAAGRWRETELVSSSRKKTKQHPIDPTGALPDGTAFSSFFELRDRVAEREGDFARGFTEALIGYGLGRPYGFTDYDLAERIASRAEKQDYRIRSFIHGLVQSRKFRTK